MDANPDKQTNGNGSHACTPEELDLLREEIKKTLSRAKKSCDSGAIHSREKLIRLRARIMKATMRHAPVKGTQ